MQVSYIKPDIRTVEPSNPYSLDLMGRMLMDKAQRYESNFAKLQDQITQFGNQAILNGATKQYADEKMKSIVDSVNGMGGVDLSEYNNVQKIQNLTSEFSRDSRIVNGISDTKRIQNLQEKYQKDLEKNPGNIVNYTLFQQDVNAYAGDTSEDARYKGMDFMTYIDVDKSMQDLMDKMKSDGILKQTGEAGKYIYTTTNEEVSGDRVEQIVYNHLQSNAAVMAQVRNNSRFYMQNTPDANLAEMFQGYSQQRVAEKAASIERIDSAIKSWNAQPSSPEKDAKLAELNKQLEFSKKDYEKYEKFAASPDEIAKQVASNKQSIWEELHTNSLVNKYKNIYAFSKYGGFKVDDVSDPYLKASMTAKKTTTEEGDAFSINDGAVVFDAQDGTTGVRDITSSSLAADVQSAMTEKSELEKQLLSDIKLRTGSVPADLTIYTKQQEDKIMKKEMADPEYLDFRQKYVNANHRISNAADILKRYEKEATALYNSKEVQEKLPEQTVIAGETYSKKETVEFMQNFGQDIKNLPKFASGANAEALWRKLNEKATGRIGDDIRRGKLNLGALHDQFYKHRDVYGFVGDYVDKNIKEAVTTRIPMRVLNDKEKADVNMMGQLTGLIAHDRQMSNAEGMAKDIKPIKFGYDRDKLIITYQFENDNKEIETATTTMLKADQTPNAFGGLLQRDPYEDMRNTVMFRGSTSPDGDIKTGTFKNTAPVIQVPYTVKNANGQIEKKFKAYYLRFSDRTRARMYGEGRNPVSALPDSGINVDYFQFVDPDDPTGWIPMVNDEKRMLPPVKTLSQAMTAAQVYLQALTQNKASQTSK